MSTQCAYVFGRGNRRGKRCEVHTKHKWCTDHKTTAQAKGGTKAAALQADPILGSGAGGNAPTTPPEKLNSSVYAITINRNKTLNQLSDGEKRKFREFIEYVCDQEQGLYDYVHDSTTDDPRENIREVICEHFFEAGSLNGLVHAHIYLSIVHTGHIRLLVEDIRALARRVFGESIWVQVSATSDPAVAYRNYIRKGTGKVSL